MYDCGFFRIVVCLHQRNQQNNELALISGPVSVRNWWVLQPHFKKLSPGTIQLVFSKLSTRSGR